MLMLVLLLLLLILLLLFLPLLIFLLLFLLLLLAAVFGIVLVFTNLVGVAPSGSQTGVPVVLFLGYFFVSYAMEWAPQVRATAQHSLNTMTPPLSSSSCFLLCDFSQSRILYCIWFYYYWLCSRSKGLIGVGGSKNYTTSSCQLAVTI